MLSRPPHDSTDDAAGLRRGLCYGLPISIAMWVLIIAMALVVARLVGGDGMTVVCDMDVCR